jgi:threonine synthase
MGKETECLGCGQKFKRSEAAVMCTVCGLWSHKTCSGISAEFFKFLAEQHKATGRAYWACRACSNYAEGMNHRLREIQEKAEEAVKLAKESVEETKKIQAQMNTEREWIREWTRQSWLLWRR